MAEDVHTGGLKKFSYQNSEIRLDDERKRAIAEGYILAGERKARERKKRRVILAIAIFITLIILVAFLLFALK